MIINYLDTKRATIAILKDWRDMEWRREHGTELLVEINDRLTAVRGTFNDATPVQGGGNMREDIVCGLLDKKDVALNGKRLADEYFIEIAAAWERLTDDERYILTARFVDGKDGGGIQRIMDRYTVEKTRAYDLANAALDRLTKLLFW